MMVVDIIRRRLAYRRLLSKVGRWTARSPPTSNIDIGGSKSSPNYRRSRQHGKQTQEGEGEGKGGVKVEENLPAVKMISLTGKENAGEKKPVGGNGKVTPFSSSFCGWGRWPREKTRGVNERRPWRPWPGARGRT